MRLAAQGHIDQAIAHQLGISPGTVKTYWGRIRTKYGSANRAELVARYTHTRASSQIGQLQEENILLIDQIGKLEREQRKLDKSVSLLEGIFSAAPDGIVIVDPSGSIRSANPAAAEMFGFEVAEMTNLQLKDLVPARFHGDHRKHREGYMKAPEKRTMLGHAGTSGVRKDGSEVLIVATLNACETADGTLAICMIRPLVL